MNFPRHIDALSANWLNALLPFEVESYASVSLGRGYMSDVYCLELQPGGEKIIIKFASADPLRHELAKRFRSYRKEHRFYATTAPGLEAQVPACYFNFYEEDDFLLGLEYLPMELDLPVDTDTALEAASMLAMIHEHPLAGDTPAFEEGYHAAITDLQAVDPGELFTAKVADLVRPYMKDPLLYLERYTSQPQVLSHMDFRLDNLRRRAGKLVLLDWGEFASAPAGVDLAAFLATIVSPNHCPELEDIVLSAYAAQRPDLSRTELDRSYRLGLLTAIYLPVLMQLAGDIDNAQHHAKQVEAAITDHYSELAMELD